MNIQHVLSKKRWQALFLAIGLFLSQVIVPAGQVFATEGGNAIGVDPASTVSEGIQDGTETLEAQEDAIEEAAVETTNTSSAEQQIELLADSVLANNSSKQQEPIVINDSKDNGELLPAWCKYVPGQGWKVDISANGNGKDGPLYDEDGVQVYAHDRSDKLDGDCRTQHQMPAPTYTAVEQCDVYDVVTWNYDSTKMTLTSETWSGNTLTAVFTAKPYYHFLKDGQSVSTISVSYVDSGRLCSELKPATAVNGEFTDPCGVTEFNLTFTPTPTEGVEYITTRTGIFRNTLTVTAKAKAGYELTNPTWSQSASDSRTPCPINWPTVALAKVDCDTVTINATNLPRLVRSDIRIMDETGAIAYTLRTDGGLATTYTATIDLPTGHTHTAIIGKTVLNVFIPISRVSMPVDLTAPCITEIPVPNTVNQDVWTTDICGTSNDPVIFLRDPKDTHYTYTDTGWYDVDGTKYERVIVFTADEGYIFPNGQSTHTTHLTDWGTPCAEPVFTPIDCNTLTAQVVVDYTDLRYTYRLSSPDMLDTVMGSGVSYEISTPGMYTVSAYIMIGDTNEKVYESKYAFAGLSCGQGNGAITPPSAPIAAAPAATPVVASATLPAKLPQTGPVDTVRGLLLTLLAGIITYGAVFFAQTKRS